MFDLLFALPVRLLSLVQTRYLLIVIIALLVDDVEESELVDTLAGRHDTEPVTELLLLEELLGAAVPRC